MPAVATRSTADAVLPLRVLYRQEMNGQILHDSIRRRDGWTVTYLLSVDGVAAGTQTVSVDNHQFAAAKQLLASGCVFRRSEPAHQMAPV